MITKDKNGENMSHLKITEVVLVHSKIVNNDYTFVPNTSFRQYLDLSPKNFIFLKIFNSEFSYIAISPTIEIVNR